MCVGCIVILCFLWRSCSNMTLEEQEEGERMNEQQSFIFEELDKPDQQRVLGRLQPTYTGTPGSPTSDERNVRYVVPLVCGGRWAWCYSPAERQRRKPCQMERLPGDVKMRRAERQFRTGLLQLPLPPRTTRSDPLGDSTRPHSTGSACRKKPPWKVSVKGAYLPCIYVASHFSCCQTRNE